MNESLVEYVPNPQRVWKFERPDGTTVLATGDEVTVSADGFWIRDECVGWGPYQTWEDLSIYATRTAE